MRLTVTLRRPSFSLSSDICWRIAEAEAALAGIPAIKPAHFWIGVCKAVDLELSALLDAAAPEWKVAEERIATDLSEGRVAMVAVGLSPVKLRRALRVELGRKPEAVKHFPIFRLKDCRVRGLQHAFCAHRATDHCAVDFTESTSFGVPELPQNNNPLVRKKSIVQQTVQSNGLKPAFRYILTPRKNLKHPQFFDMNHSS